PEPNVSVTFAVTAGGSGASAAFTGSATVTTDTNGFATAPVLTANGIAGSFTVAATSGAASATFNLAVAQPTYALGGSSATLGAAAGGSYVSLGINPPNAGWTASSDSTWLHVDGTGTGNTVQYTVDANAASTPRSGVLTIGGQTFTVTQAGSGYVA